MLQKIKMLILKIIFSPLWLFVSLFYLLTKGCGVAFNIWNKEDDMNIWEYWRL